MSDVYGKYSEYVNEFRDFPVKTMANRSTIPPMNSLPLIAAGAASRATPTVFSILLFLAGGMLLVSGVLPAVPDHIVWLRKVLPLGLIEISHLLNTLLGVFLLFLARAVRLRLDAAYYSTIITLIAAIIVSLTKGFDWHEAALLTLMLILFIPARKTFNRHASLFTIPFPPVWVGVIVLAVGLSIWFGLMAYRHIQYAHDLWFHFSYHGDAPRFMRAALASVVFAFAYALYNMLNVARPAINTVPTGADIELARIVAGASHDPVGFLALLGDKSLLWSADRTAFIMYATTPRYWVAMGDPVGDPTGFAGLVWTFREMADLHAAHAVFYEVTDRHLPLYLDRGFAMLKMGEEARIPLADFSLEGGRRENMRKARNKFSKQGFVFRVLDPAGVTAAMPRLREISNLWMAKKNAHEKGFSLGFFAPDYIARTRVAVVEKDGTIFAFANFWELDNRDDISLDLMRYAPDSPASIMEFLFVEAILWARENGFRWFGLGMAPLSGMENHPLAPLWHKIGRVIYNHGEDFYNFEGLHAYKSKFDPVWRPRYLAAPPGPHIPLILISAARIIAGGFKGIFRK